MKSIAESLVYAVAYLNLRGDGESYATDDADVAALETIAGLLANCSLEEKQALRMAAEKLLKEELASLPRNEFVELYQNWIEDMFGGEE